MTTLTSSPSSPTLPAPARTAVNAEENLRKALASRTRPQPPSAVSASLTLGWRALLKIKHVPEQLFDVTAFPVISTLMFTFLFGGALAGSTEAYVQFVLPGILVQTVAMITMYTGMALNTDITKGIFDRFRTLPIWRPSVLVGALLGDVVRYATASAVVIALGLVLGFRPAAGLVGVLLSVGLLLLFSFSLAWVWSMLGLLMHSPTAVLNMSMMILFPLTFISNVFVEPSTMPWWLELFVNLNPISHVVTAVRGLMAGTVAASDIALVLGECVAFVAIFGPLTMRLYHKPR